MKNLEKFYRVLEEERLDGLMLTSQTTRMYCAEFDVAEGVSVVTPKGCRFFTDSRYIEVAEKNLPDFQVIMVDHSRNYAMLIQQAIDEFQIKKMGFEEKSLTVAEFLGYQKKLSVEFVPCQQAMNRLRCVKEPWELERLRKAQEITDLAYTEILTKIHPGMSEKQLMAELIYCLYKNGADGLSFQPVVVSGPNTSMPHGVAGERALQNGDFITMDFGCTYRGYCSDMTRTVALESVTDEMRRVYDVVLRAQTAAITASRAGVPGNVIDGVARQVIRDAGYGDYFGHGYGHCVGLEIHENPNCNMGNDQPMPAGAVCSAEPGIYLPDKFGVRIEDVVIFTEEGCIDITASPKALTIL
ncbi:MAG: aminopeptidase P family protein [Oscillospiraceae bacterium]|nr:aminopeptidase P family protein [Oscillospiraceae bacterium]